MTSPDPQTLARLLAHLLRHRQWIPNRAFIACLALAHLNPDPTVRVRHQQLQEALQLCHGSVRKVLLELRRLGLLDYEASPRGGYLIKRVGPRPPPAPAAAPLNPSTQPNP